VSLALCRLLILASTFSTTIISNILRWRRALIPIAIHLTPAMDPPTTTAYNPSKSSLILCITPSLSYQIPWRSPTPFLDGPIHSDSDSIIISSADDDSTHRRRFIFGTPTSRAASPENLPSPVATAMGQVGEELGVSPLRDWRGTAVWATKTSQSNSDFRLRLDQVVKRSSSVRAIRGASSFGTENETEMRDIVGARRRDEGLGSATNDGGSDLQHAEDEISLSMALGSGPVAVVPAASGEIEAETVLFVPRRSSSGSKFREEIVFPTKPENPLQWIRQFSRKTIRRTSLEIPRLLRSRRQQERAKVLVTFPGSKKLFRFIRKHHQEPAIALDERDGRPSEPPLKTFGPRSQQHIPNHGNQQAKPMATESISEGTTSRRLRSTAPEPPSRLMALRGAVGSSFKTHHVNRDHTLIPRDEINNVVIPARPSTAPPGKVHMELEFLTTEATGFHIPDTIPNLDPRKIGTKKNKRSKEMAYFDQQNMIQSRPKMPPPNEPPDVPVDPADRTIVHTTGNPHPIAAYPNVDAIAPFLEQDRELERRSADLISRPSSTTSKTRLFKPPPLPSPPLARRGNHDLLLLRPSSTPPALSIPARGTSRTISTITTATTAAASTANTRTHSPTTLPPQVLPDPPSPSSPSPSTSRRKKSLTTWLRTKHAETGEDYSHQPIDVQLERMRRDMRDTGIMGLMPMEELHGGGCGSGEEGGSEGTGSDASVSYAAAAREVVGMGKRRGWGRRGSVRTSGGPERGRGGATKGVEVLMG
ncbi:hypothetical protein EX30DRAFT_391211, partial [Ascodesmis nigricans]